MPVEQAAQVGSDYTLVETCSTQIEGVQKSVDEACGQIEELRMGVDTCHFELDYVRESAGEVSDGLKKLEVKVDNERVELKDDLTKLKDDIETRLPAVEEAVATNFKTVMSSLAQMQCQVTNIEQIVQDELVSSDEDSGSSDDDYEEDITEEITKAVTAEITTVRDELVDKIDGVDQVLGDVQNDMAMCQDEVTDLAENFQRYKHDSSSDLETIIRMIEDLTIEEPDERPDSPSGDGDFEEIKQVLKDMHDDIKSVKQRGELVAKYMTDFLRPDNVRAQYTLMSTISDDTNSLMHTVSQESRLRAEQHAELKEANTAHAAEIASMKSDIAEMKELLIEHVKMTRVSEPLNLRKIESDHLSVLQRGIGSVVDGARIALDTKIQSMQPLADKVVDMNSKVLDSNGDMLKMITGRVDELSTQLLTFGKRFTDLQNDLVSTSREHHDSTVQRVDELLGFVAEEVLHRQDTILDEAVKNSKVNGARDSR